MDIKIFAFEMSKYAIPVIGVLHALLFISISFIPKEKYLTINGVECVKVSKGIFCNCNK